MKYGDFNKWWGGVYLNKPSEIHRQCFEEGFAKGYAEGVEQVRILQFFLIGAITFGITLLLSILF